MVSHAYRKDGTRYNDGPYRHGHRPNKYERAAYKPLRQFRAVDGEGGNVAEEGTLFGVRHQYLSLRMGPEILETGNPLSWQQCLEFISSQDPRYIYVSYFFDYDVTMIIRTLPEERARRLLYPSVRRAGDNSSNYLPVDVGDYQIDYLPHKEFRVRKRGTIKWIIISDVGQFFQTSFLKTLDRWDIGTPEEREMIRKGKSMRAHFTEHTEEIEAYNALECVLLEELMVQFRGVCIETGYVPRKWQGPGYLASAMLEKHGVPKRDSIPILQNMSFKELAQAGYYGGRFETACAGPVPGPVYQYDINGAYVHLLRSLPCLIHGSWRRVHKRPDRGTIYFGQVHFDHDAPRNLFNLPVRNKQGNICFPKEGHGVYWGVELDAAERSGTRLDFSEGWVYENHCECRWFDFVDPYYELRLSLGKSSKGYVLKLAGNSVYGKIAQSIGYAPWANPVWAGMITAGCRAMLIDAYSQAPDDCMMLATDGLFMTSKLNLPISKKLGEWEETIHPDGIFIVQPGIYFTSDEIKTRGVERGRITGMRSIFEQKWQEFIKSRGVDHTVSVPVDNFITAKQALQRKKWKLAGTWEHTTREISYDWSGKRKRGIAFHTDGIMRTVPYDGGNDVYSVPYHRIIGGNEGDRGTERYFSAGLLEAERIAEQPDWVEPFLATEL